MLKGGFVNVQQKFFRVFRLTKLTFLLAFTIAGYNVECIRSFVACDPQGERKERSFGAESVLGHGRPCLIDHDPGIHAGDHAIAPPDPQDAESHEIPGPPVGLVINPLRKDRIGRLLAHAACLSK
jgi:hypothetical protein